MVTEIDNIGSRIGALIDYLGISPHEFAKRCGLSSGQIISPTISKENKPSMTTLEKILNRYPVESGWLLLGKGKIWKEDYFQKRFESIKSKPKSPTEQITILLDVFEMNQRQFCQKTGVGTCTMSAIKKGERIEVSKSVRDKICEKYPFINPVWFFI